MSYLVVRFLEDEWGLPPGTELTFGRSADVVVDSEDTSLHRVAGRFTHAIDVGWILVNEGSQIPLSVRTLEDAPSTVVHSGHSLAVPFTEFVVGFSSKRCTYELSCRQPDMRGIARPELTGSETVLGSISLTNHERRVVDVLREPLQRGDLIPVALSRSEIRLRADLPSVSAVDDTIDRICGKLDKAGYPGFGNLTRTAERRRLLAALATQPGLFGAD